MPQRRARHQCSRSTGAGLRLLLARGRPGHPTLRTPDEMDGSMTDLLDRSRILWAAGLLRAVTGAMLLLAVLLAPVAAAPIGDLSAVAASPRHNPDAARSGAAAACREARAAAAAGLGLVPGAAGRRVRRARGPRPPVGRQLGLARAAPAAHN